MPSWIFIILYIVFAVSGSSLLKYGASNAARKLLAIPFINVSVSIQTIIGFVSYGISFLLYTILLSKYDLSFISPLTVGIVYVALMLTAFILFKEPISATKIIGSAFILIGILLIVIKK